MPRRGFRWLQIASRSTGRDYTATGSSTFRSEGASKRISTGCETAKTYDYEKAFSLIRNGGLPDGRLLRRGTLRAPVRGEGKTRRSLVPAGSRRHGRLARTHDARHLLHAVVQEHGPAADPEKGGHPLDRGHDANRPARRTVGAMGRTEDRRGSSAVPVQSRTAAGRLPDRSRNQLGVGRLEQRSGSGESRLR